MARRKPYDWCEDEIIRLVIQPKVDFVIDKYQPASKSDLLLRFNEEFQCDIAPSRMAYWLDKMGYEVRTVAVVNRPQPAVPAAPTPAELLQQAPVPPGVTENPVRPGVDQPQQQAAARRAGRSVPVPGAGGLVGAGG